jgi:YidC/Oxa1 family membrane protein insertase
MLHSLWDNLLYEPLLNALAFLINVIPGGDLGLAVIILTLLVKLALAPLSKKSIQNQAAMNKLSPELDRIKNSGLSKEEQARKTFELYKENKTNPFSGCFLVLIQIPIIFALYFTFFRGVNFSPDILYSFIKLPDHMSSMFLGLIDVSGKSLLLAILTGISQYLQAHFMPNMAMQNNSSKDSFSSTFSKSLNMQMKYVFPFIMGFISYSSGVIALYFITSNIFAVAQQILLKKKTE